MMRLDNLIELIIHYSNKMQANYSFKSNRIGQWTKKALTRYKIAFYKNVLK